MAQADNRDRRFVEASTDCMKELDLSGSIRFISGRACAMLGLENAGVMVGTSWFELWPEESRPLVAAAVALAATGERAELLCARPGKDGEKRWWDVSITPVREPDGRVTGLIAVSRDVSERMQLQFVLESINTTLQGRLNTSLGLASESTERYDVLMRRWRGEGAARRVAEDRVASLSSQLGLASAALLMAEETTRQAQKQQAIGQLVSGLGHDFNNMLQIVIVSLSGLDDLKETLSPQQQKMLRYATEGTRHAAALTRRLLAFSRTNQARRETLDLGDIVRELADFARHGMGGKVGLIVDDPGLGLPMHGDRDALEQAVLNLCINARDAMSRGGEIVLQLGTQEVPSMAENDFVDRRPGSYVTISVTDTGTGMTEEVRQRLFEPYFTTKPGGNGLGLAQVYGMVAQGGGFVDVVSEPGAGTRITLAFPRYEGLADSAEIDPQ
jgi:PAS domain S-box-containing protein